MLRTFRKILSKIIYSVTSEGVLDSLQEEKKRFQEVHALKVIQGFEKLKDFAYQIRNCFFYETGVMLIPLFLINLLRLLKINFQ